MAIKKLEEIRLNVQPVSIEFVHEYVFEGPCRFGKGDALTKPFDEMVNEEKFQDWYTQLKAHMHEDVVNLLPPIRIHGTEDWYIKDEEVRKIITDATPGVEVDLYFSVELGRVFLLNYEVARLTDKPWAMVQACCYTANSCAQHRARGIEYIPFETWEAAEDYMVVLRAKKALKNTRILCAIRNNSSVSVSSSDSIIDPDKTMDEVFGARQRTISAHELLDQTSYGDPMGNHCTPGRKGLNFTEEDAKEIERQTRELIDNAQEVRMNEEAVKKSVEMRYAIHKFMEANDCNCYAAPCGDICSTRRMNEQQVTMCLNHALNNEEGIPSACEYDLAALISMVMLQSIGRRPSYMGNTYAIPRQKDGKHIPFPKMPFFDKEETARQLAKLENVDNLVLTFHSVPNRRWTSYDAPVRPYAIGPFTHSGWGATIRYDFAADEGQVVTMCRVDPTCKKILIAKGTIVGGLGYGSVNCSEGVFFEVKDVHTFWKYQMDCGNHVPLIYGDFEDQLVQLAESLGLEVLRA